MLVRFNEVPLYQPMHVSGNERTVISAHYRFSIVVQQASINPPNESKRSKVERTVLSSRIQDVAEPLDYVVVPSVLPTLKNASRRGKPTSRSGAERSRLRRETAEESEGEKGEDTGGPTNEATKNKKREWGER